MIWYYDDDDYVSLIKVLINYIIVVWFLSFYLFVPFYCWHNRVCIYVCMYVYKYILTSLKKLWWLREGCFRCIMVNGEKDGYLNWEKKVGSDSVVLFYYYYDCCFVRSRREQRKHSRGSRCGGVCVGGLFVRAIICSVSTVTLTLYSVFSLHGPHLSPFSATLYS